MELGNDCWALIVRFELLDGHELAFDELTMQTVASIRRQEPATLAYVIHREPASPRVRIFYELYRDAAAFKAHESAPHTRRFLAERGQHLTTVPDVCRLIPFDYTLRPTPDPGTD